MYERLFSLVMSRADYHARTFEACATLAAQAAPLTKRKDREMFLSSLTSAQQATFLALADRVIHADGRLAAEEAAILDALRREIPEPDLVPSDTEDASLPVTFPDRRSRVSAVLELIGIAHADGHFDETEGEVIAEIEDAFGFSQTDRALLRDWVLRQLALVRDAEELMQAGE